MSVLHVHKQEWWVKKLFDGMPPLPTHQPPFIIKRRLCKSSSCTGWVRVGLQEGGTPYLSSPLEPSPPSATPSSSSSLLLLLFLPLPPPYPTCHLSTFLSPFLPLLSSANLSSLAPPLTLHFPHLSLTHHFPLVLRDEVHLVDEAKHLCIRGVLQDRLQARLIVVHVLLHLPALHVKHVDEHLHVAEHVVTLTCEVVLHKCLLPGWKQNINHS